LFGTQQRRYTVCGTLAHVAEYAPANGSKLGRNKRSGRTGPAVDDIVDLCADALGLIAQPEESADAMKAP
jgi:hypothetical protein